MTGVPSSADSPPKIFLSCRNDSPTLGFPLYATDRPEAAPGGSVEAELSRLLAYQLDGTTPREAAAGFVTAVTGGSDLLQSVTVSDGVAQIDFSPALAGSPNLGTANLFDSFQAQLTAVALQLPGVDSVELTVEGSCDAFFMIGERVCTELPQGSPASG